jgi:hypothetical protein
VGAGRKPLPEDARRDRSVFVRLTREEEEALAEAAQGEPLASFVRRIVLRYLARRRK